MFSWLLDVFGDLPFGWMNSLVGFGVDRLVVGWFGRGYLCGLFVCRRKLWMEFG